MAQHSCDKDDVGTSGSSSSDSSSSSSSTTTSSSSNSSSSSSGGGDGGVVVVAMAVVEVAPVVVVVMEERVRHRRWWLCCRWWRRHGLVPVFARPLPVAHERLTPTLTASRRSRNRRQKRARGNYRNARLVDCGRSCVSRGLVPVLAYDSRVYSS